MQDVLCAVVAETIGRRLVFRKMRCLLHVLDEANQQVTLLHVS